MKRKGENISIKYLMGAANLNELEELSIWLKDPKNKEKFNAYIRLNYAMDMNTNSFDLNEAKKEYLRKIGQSKKRVNRRKTFKIFKYAAAAILIFGLGYFLKEPSLETKIENSPTLVNEIQHGTDKAVLTLEDGTQIPLEKGNNIQTKNATSNGEGIVYENDENENFELVFNNLTVPRGGQFFIELSDGTKVWLNSESKLKYPVNFKKGQTREVELVYGEAYFEVSPSTNHNGAQFKVLNAVQEVEVIGTEFNIKAYKDETNVYTTLIEGKVALNYDGKRKNLIPGLQSNVDEISKTISIGKVDVKSVVSWKNGIFSFIDMPLKDIMKVISRWYDVEIIFENKKLESVEFIGVLEKNQSIEEVLSIIKSTSINNYVIDNKTIILK